MLAAINYDIPAQLLAYATTLYVIWLRHSGHRLIRTRRIGQSRYFLHLLSRFVLRIVNYISVTDSCLATE